MCSSGTLTHIAAHLLGCPAARGGSAPEAAWKMVTGSAGSVGCRLQNKGLHQTKSAPRFTAEGAAFAGEPRCSAGKDAAGGVTPWGCDDLFWSRGLLRPSAWRGGTGVRGEGDSHLQVVSPGRHSRLSPMRSPSGASIRRMCSSGMLAHIAAHPLGCPAARGSSALEAASKMVTSSAGSVGWRLQNKGLHQTKSAPRFTAEGAAFAGEPQC
jgi:hypothetical protein